MATFQELRSLQAREITENDYDLLMRLRQAQQEGPLRRAARRRHRDLQCKECLPCAGETCAVCLSEMAPGTTLCRLKYSGQHAFHADCIKEWLTTASTCCRSTSGPLDVGLMREQLQRSLFERKHVCAPLRPLWLIWRACLAYCVCFSNLYPVCLLFFVLGAYSAFLCVSCSGV